MRHRPWPWFLALCLLATPASAQIGGLPLPDAPIVGGVLDQAADLSDTLDIDALQNARAVRIRELLRVNRRTLERGPGGHPIVRSQILALGMSDAALEAAAAAGFQIVRRDALDGIGDMLTLRAPAGMSTRRALRRLRDLDAEGAYDFDHLHIESGVPGALPVLQQSAAQAQGVRIGLIDGGVGGAARAALLEERSFASDAPSPSPHGSAIAALLIQAAPSARIIAADIYGGAPTGGAASALARALSWLAEQRVAVINVSLVGPRNLVLESLVERLVARGHLIVAAVGNDGPAAAPLYPAAYEGVVGVTGVDARDRVLIEAGRGAHVDFAALGITDAQDSEGRARRVRGTSYAAPIVSAALAQRLATPEASGAGAAVAALRSSARDLGSRGRDDIYGYGAITSPGPLARR